MNKAGLAAVVALTLVGAATLADAAEFPTFTFGASVSFVFDINQPDQDTTAENQKAYADGESEESFNIDLVQLGISGSRGRVSYGAKVDFGDWADTVADNLEDEVALQEMFLAVDTGPVLLSAGRMPTPIGYEVLEPWANANISRSRAWFFQPISHDGVAISGELGGVDLMAAVVNGMRVSDDGINNPDDEYAVIASAGTSFSTNELRLSAIYSDEHDEVRFFEINGLLAGSVKPWRYGLEATWLDGDGHGGTDTALRPDSTMWDVTGYGGATFGHWSGDLRLAYTDQEATNESLGYLNDEGIVSFTATGGYEIVEGVVIRVEYRLDKSDESIFDEDQSPSDPLGHSDIVHVVQAQLMWTPATGLD